MSAMQPVPKDHPLMLAWITHKQTEEYANSKRWAAYEQRVDRSLWELFSAGWAAAESDRLAGGAEAVAVPSPDPQCCGKCDKPAEQPDPMNDPVVLRAVIEDLNARVHKADTIITALVQALQAR